MNEIQRNMTAYNDSGKDHYIPLSSVWDMNCLNAVAQSQERKVLSSIDRQMYKDKTK